MIVCRRAFSALVIYGLCGADVSSTDSLAQQFSLHIRSKKGNFVVMAQAAMNFSTSSHHHRHHSASFRRLVRFRPTVLPKQILFVQRPTSTSHALRGRGPRRLLAGAGAEAFPGARQRESVRGGGRYGQGFYVMLNTR